MKTAKIFFHGTQKLLEQVFSCLAPPRCRMCRTPLFNHQNPFLCAPCIAQIPWIGAGACGKCGYPSGQYAEHRRDCLRCRGNRIRLTGTTAVARYRGGARNLVRSLKFRGETELVRPMAELMALRLRESAFFPSIDVVIPVVLHQQRKRERGFDQARLLARQVASSSGLPYSDTFLQRTVLTPPQATLNRLERLQNMRGCFTVNTSLEKMHVLLVDDVMTTGATMDECACACREAGAGRVYALVFAR